ncbi:unnamed protein product [Linum trigynum]|uniref:Uncharacterized protein n=1 Tax=Linum trigynum TaxID=586398 RepID=A0AAV2FEQ5_9ROSI
MGDALVTVRDLSGVASSAEESRSGVLVWPGSAKTVGRDGPRGLEGRSGRVGEDTATDPGSGPAEGGAGRRVCWRPASRSSSSLSAV